MDKKLLFGLVSITAILAILFSVLATIYNANKMYSTLGECFMGLMFLLDGILDIKYSNKETHGYIKIGVSIIILGLMCFTIYHILNGTIK